jgi:hypothetical protein
MGNLTGHDVGHDEPLVRRRSDDDAVVYAPGFKVTRSALKSDDSGELFSSGVLSFVLSSELPSSFTEMPFDSVDHVCWYTDECLRFAIDHLV